MRWPASANRFCLDALPALLVEATPEGVCTAAEGSGLAAFGLTPHSAVGQPLESVFGPAAAGRAVQGAEVVDRVDAGDQSFAVCLGQRRDGRLVGVGVEVRERVAANRGDRRQFLERVSWALERWNRHHGTLVLAVVDLDRFGLVNETVGYDAGDALLTTLAARLHDGFRATDLVSLLAADVAVLCTAPQAVNDHGVVTIAERIRGAVEEPVEVAGREVFLSASIGLALAHSGVDVEGMLLEAEGAAADAKRRGGGRWALADGGAGDRTVGLLELEQGLRRALENDEFVVHYQPIVELATGAVVGVEALVRWAPPEGGLVPPGAFVPVAEESGLIVPLGRWVLQEVTHQATRHPLLSGAVTGCPLFVSVNVSPRQLGSPGLPRLVADTLRGADVHPSRLCLELTESALVPDLVEAAAVLDELKAVGCGIAIDDFGTGWSSLSHLKHFPVDALKIDRSFVEGLARPGGDRAISEVIVTLAHSLGLVAVAEGVETEEQLTVLRAIGCDRAQGYHFARPMPLDDLAAEVERWR
jgi:diguanylate cyclase (GGDEF)-like protein